VRELASARLTPSRFMGPRKHLSRGDPLATQAHAKYEFRRGNPGGSKLPHSTLDKAKFCLTRQLY